MAQGTELKDHPTHDGEETASSTNVALETGYLHAQIEIRSMSFTLYKYQLKMD
jgi:hypothetical protein